MSETALDVSDWGRLGYGPALDKQREWNQAVQAEERLPTLALVEHDPVVTVSRRPEAAAHLVADSVTLARLGIEVVETDRGGDITYHGPGQLVAYPFVRLKPMGLGIAEYMRFLEQVVIDTLAGFGLSPDRVAGKTGVWLPLGDASAADKPVCKQGQCDSEVAVDSAAPKGSLNVSNGPKWGKVCAMGVRVRRGVTMHGLALNVCPDLSHFQTIVPCGLPDPVLALSEYAPEKTWDMAVVKDRLAEVFTHHWQWLHEHPGDLDGLAALA